METVRSDGKEREREDSAEKLRMPDLLERRRSEGGEGRLKGGRREVES